MLVRALFEKVTQRLVTDFSQRFNITFQMFDLSDLHTLEEFKGRAAELGWITDAGPSTQ